MAIGTAPLSLDALVGVAGCAPRPGRSVAAAELLGLALNHPAAQSDSVELAKAALAGLRECFPADQLEAALERGKGWNWTWSSRRCWPGRVRPQKASSKRSNWALTPTTRTHQVQATQAGMKGPDLSCGCLVECILSPFALGHVAQDDKG